MFLEVVSEFANLDVVIDKNDGFKKKKLKFVGHKKGQLKEAINV